MVSFGMFHFAGMPCITPCSFVRRLFVAVASDILCVEDGQLYTTLRLSAACLPVSLRRWAINYFFSNKFLYQFFRVFDAYNYLSVVKQVQFFEIEDATHTFW
jgi:hypothetical protein